MVVSTEPGRDGTVVVNVEVGEHDLLYLWLIDGKPARPQAFPEGLKRDPVPERRSHFAPGVFESPVGSPRDLYGSAIYKAQSARESRMGHRVLQRHIRPP